VRRHTAAIPLLSHRHLAMSNVVLPNFDWAHSNVNDTIKSQATAAAQVQYRLDRTMRLIPFRIPSKKDINTRPSLNAAGMVAEHVKLFLAKKLLLGWLYLQPDPSLHPNAVPRLAAYVRYYEEILDQIRNGDTNILERWWVLETTFEYSQHSASKAPRSAGLHNESEALELTLIDWNLEEIYPVENLALVSNEALNKAADHVGDWITDEVDREVRPEESHHEMTDDGEL